MMITILSLFSNTAGGTAIHKYPVYLTGILRTTKGGTRDDGDVTEQGANSYRAGHKRVIQNHEESGKLSSQEDNDIISIITGHSFTT